MGFKLLVKNLSIITWLYVLHNSHTSVNATSSSWEVEKNNLQALLKNRGLGKKKQDTYDDDVEREKKKDAIHKKTLRDKENNERGKTNVQLADNEKVNEKNQQKTSAIECTQTQLLLSSFTNRDCSTESLTSSPSFSAFPTIFRSESPSSFPSLSESSMPSFLPSSSPSSNPSITLSETPSASPSVIPSDVPSQLPTISLIPTVSPSTLPSSIPSFEPTKIPSSNPSLIPTIQSSVLPSLKPSTYPSSSPTDFPSVLPTYKPSSQPSILPTNVPSFYPSKEPTFSPSGHPTNVPSFYPSTEPTLYPSEHPSNVPSSAPSKSFIPSMEPTRFPQNTCFFSQDIESDTSCKDRIISNSTESERTLYVDDFLCSENKQFRFGITLDKFLCLCDGNQKIWCAESCCQRRRDPFVELKRNGCVSAYADRLVGKREVWVSDPSADDAFSDEISIEDKGGLIRRERKVRRLQVTNDGAIVVVDHLDPSILLWEGNLDFYVPFHPPTAGPTFSSVPSLPPTTSPAPSASLIPSSSPVIITNPPSVQATFRAGDLYINNQFGMRVSRGLSVRIIGETGKRSRYSNGLFSPLPVHDRPDAGGCFDQPDGGWIYVSNAEVDKKGGGVGAFKFESNGDLVNYKMIQTGSNMNCGGGISPWGTWFSGEEFNGNPKGGMWEVDINGNGARMTQFGRGKFESAICDDRDMNELECFATIDEVDESLRRYEPSPRVLQDAVSSGDYSQVMHSPGGTLTYLVLNPLSGKYFWTTNKASADASAKKYYPNLEGIDHHDGKLYFVSKMKRELFVLDLDGNTYQSSTTQSGSFEAQPDQIAHIIGDDPNGSSLMYFLEDGGKEPGVFARNLKENKAFTLIEKIKDKFEGDETTGLAFCDGFTRLIFAFQERGIIYEVTRDDGLPFYGAAANVKYHNTQFSRNTAGDARTSASQDNIPLKNDSNDFFHESG